MTVTDPYTGIGVITRGVFDSDMAAISLSLHSSCNDIALNEKNSPSFCQIHFYRGIFHLLSSCTLSTLRAFNSSSFHPSSPQIHPFSMIPVTPHLRRKFQSTHSLRSATVKKQQGRVNFQSFNPRTRESATVQGLYLHRGQHVSIHALVRVRLLNVYGLIINSATGVLRQPPMGGTKIPGREKEMIVVKIRTPTDYENRRCPGNFL